MVLLIMASIGNVPLEKITSRLSEAVRPVVSSIGNFICHDAPALVPASEQIAARLVNEARIAGIVVVESSRERFVSVTARTIEAKQFSAKLRMDF